ncbi:MAG: DUF1553 domain-containing protein [Saprospiraceae bacterium]
MPTRFIFYNLLLFCGLLLTACQSDVPEEISSVYSELPDKIDFNFHVRPILSDRCYACHGPDENAREAKYRLDIEEGAFAALQNSDGFSIVAGNPKESRLVHRILSDESDYMMPPPTSEMSLTAREKAILYKWIQQGAEWKKHWAFIPPTEVNPPSVSNSSWAQNEIDNFILKKQQELHIKPAKPANKEQWLRRVTFDLTGLPPTPQALEHFKNDDSENAFEKVVDALLSSSAYGERMTSVWLDVARYADSHGYQDDRPRTAWSWRDWVIKAFNENLPYDKFATYQIAGDLLPDATYEQKLATGFNRNHAITQEGGIVQEEYLTEYAADRAQTFSTAFLGLTMECARCHTHKYDPIEQKEYYSLFGFFNNISEKGRISYFDEAPRPNMAMVDPLLDEQIEEVKNWIAQKEKALAEIAANSQTDFKAWLVQDFKENTVIEDIEEGLIADFNLNNLAHNQFANQLEGQPNGLMNINLPPNIPQPIEVNTKDGKGLFFNGKNFLSLGEIGDFEWYDAFSFGGWIKHSGKHRKNAGIFARRVGEQKRQGYDLILTPQNRLRARLIHQYYKKNRGSAVNYAIDIQANPRVASNQWQHVFVTYDGSGKATGLNIYLNGQLQNSQIKMDSLRGKTILNGNDFLVGNWNHRARELDDLYGFKGGTVDDVKVYKRALSPLEIKQLANNKQLPNQKELYAHFLQKKHPSYRQLQLELDSLRAIDLEKPKVMVMKEVDTVKSTFVLNRGAYDAPTDLVERETPKAVLAFSTDYPKNRLGLAQWLFDEKHPLTSRVIVNRYWQLIFGSGIVATPEDFGNQGALPTHPELLDWLAVYFRENDWDTKDLLKKMVLSAVYRQDAKMTPTSKEKDPSNVWLSRGPSQKLTAEMLRDQALVASNLYYEKVGGKWVKPYQPAGIWKELANQIGENKYRPSRGKDLYRRSLYSYWKRTIPPPTMLTFDASERAVCTVKRQQTSTPLQSLILLNNPIYIEASRKIAEQLMQQDLSLTKRLEMAFIKIISRTPKSNEIQLLMDLYNEELKRLITQPEQAIKLVNIGASTYDKKLNVNELATLSIVINAILNLDETKYK